MKSLLVSLFTLLLLTACGGGSSDPKQLNSEGNQALGSNDYDAARTAFEKALTAIGDDPNHAQFLTAKLGWIEALTQIDGPKAKDEFLKLAKEHSDKVTDRDFNLIGSRLDEGGHMSEAIALVQAGKEAYPDSASLTKLVQVLGDKAAAGGEDGALEALRGLGYVGD